MCLEQDLGSMVTQALAIPLATDLPTPNGRKTCALAIWLLQTQRLPADVLARAKDRIAYALRRAIEGELGKEGKKGAVSDGLKVKPPTITCDAHPTLTDLLSRRSTILPFTNPLSSYLPLPNSSPPFSTTCLLPGSRYELMPARLSVALPSP